MSCRIDSARLSSSLKISAAGQVPFLRKLCLVELPIRKSAQAGMLELSKIDSNGDGRLDGKTGSGIMSRNRRLGWFVGLVRHSGKDYIFALNFTDRFEGRQRASQARQPAKRPSKGFLSWASGNRD